MGIFILGAVAATAAIALSFAGIAIYAILTTDDTRDGRL